MKIFFLLCLTFAATFANAQKNDTIRKYLDQQLRFTSKGKSVFPAVAVKQPDGWFFLAMYADTTPLLKAYFKDKNFSVKNGPYQLYHGKNIRAMQGTYLNNLPQGTWRYWHSNGQLKDSGLLIDNVMCGLWQSWNSRGQLLISVNYQKEPANNNLKAVPKKASTLLPEISPFPGKREGSAVAYHPNGQMQDSGTFKDDQRTGAWKTWYENGRIAATGSYELDSVHGNWTYYRENGNKSTDESYVMGKLQAMTCYDSLGNKESNYCSILKPPVPLGPFDNFTEYVLDNVFWPKGLIDSDVQGVVKVEYVITQQGELRNFKVIESPHQLLSDEVTRFFSTIEQWSPAISHNRIIDFKMQYEVPFYR